MLNTLPKPARVSDLPAETDVLEAPTQTRLEETLSGASSMVHRPTGKEPDRHELIMQLAQETDERLPTVLYYLSQKFSQRQIASNMGITYDAVRQILKRARARARKGHIEWVMNNIAVPQAVQNLVEGLMARDKDYTLATARGRGLLVNHTAVKQEGTGTQLALVVRVEQAPHLQGKSPAEVLPGSIVGAPALEAHRE